MKAIVISDIHVHNYKAFSIGDSRLNATLKVIELVFAYANKHKIQYILFCGDLYDNPKLLPTAAVNNLISLFVKLGKDYPSINFIAISGNHDHASKNLIDQPAITALTHLEEVCSNFVLIDNATYYIDEVDGYIHGIPYYEYPEHYKQALESVGYRSGSLNYLLIHQTPSNIGNDCIHPDTDINDPLYSKYDYIFCGHIHKRMQLNEKFLVVGSPIHRSLEDEGQDKGFIVINLRNPNEGYTPVSLDKIFPRFKRKYVGEELCENDREDDYIVWLPVVAETTEASQVSIKDFQSDLSRETLVRNYWQTVEGTDEELLKVGLKFL